MKLDLKINVFLILICFFLACKQKTAEKKIDSEMAKKAKLEHQDSIYTLNIPLLYPGPFINISTHRIRYRNDVYQDYTLNIQIMIDTINHNNQSKIGVPKKVKFKVIYNSIKNDSLMFDANLSVVKYYGDYFILAYPKYTEWSDFAPPKAPSGRMLFRPIAFLIDTIEYKLIRLKYNDRMKLIPRDIRKIKFYHFNKYGFQFRWAFTLSKSKKEYVFGKEVYTYTNP